MREGLLCKETHDNVIRLAPPLTIEREDLLWACDRIQSILEAQ
jgi:ornithine--oxo-acid transaminase